MEFARALCDLGASINLMPLVVYKKLRLGAPTPTNMRLLMEDRTVKKPMGILYDMLVKVEKFIFPSDFVILDYGVDFEVPIILGRPFLATGRTLVDIEKGPLKFRFGKDKVMFNVCQQAKNDNDVRVVLIIETVDDSEPEVPLEIRLGVDTLEAVLMNFGSDGIPDYKETINALGVSFGPRRQTKLELDLQN